MNLSPVEAINRINESVTVEMLVQRTKCCTGSKQVSWIPRQATVIRKTWVWSSPRMDGPKFAEAGIDDPTAHFSGKTIRVHGVVIRKEKGPYIEVNDPSQIEMMK